MKTSFKKSLLSLFLCASVVLSFFIFSSNASAATDENQSVLGSRVLPASDNPFVINESLISEKGHIARLREEESDLNTIVFKNNDSTATMYYFGDAVKYINSQGIICDKSNKLYSTFDQKDLQENTHTLIRITILTFIYPRV